MGESGFRPSRRGVLVMLGVGVVAPAAVAVQLNRPGGGEVDGLRFDVLGVGRHPLAGHARLAGRALGEVTDHSHDAGAAAHLDHSSWPDIVRVQLQVQNLAATPLLVSPGQFRMRVHTGLSVMPTAWQHEPEALAAGGTRTGWVDYRAPAAGGLYQLEFSPAGYAKPVSVTLAVSGGAA